MKFPANSPLHTVPKKTLIATVMAIKSYPEPEDAIFYVTFPSTYFGRGRLISLKKTLLAEFSQSLKSVTFAPGIPFKVKSDLRDVKFLFEGFPLLKLRCSLSATSSVLDCETFALKGYPFLKFIAVNVGGSFFDVQTLARWSTEFDNNLSLVNPLIATLNSIGIAINQRNNIPTVALAQVTPVASYAYGVLSNAIWLIHQSKNASAKSFSEIA